MELQAPRIYFNKYQCKSTKLFIMGNNITYTIYCNYRTVATPYKLGFLQVYYCEYTDNHHDGDNEKE
jgi:hypothetical protein